MGEVALEYYESGKQVNPRRIRMLYSDFYHRLRQQMTAEELRKDALDGKDGALKLETPG
jgi:hypothetical protein